MPKRLRYFLQSDADLQGAALRLSLRVVEQCLRAHNPGSGPAARPGGVVFHAATGIDANAIADVQACVRRRLLRVSVRRGLLPGDDAQAMGQWAHDGGFSVDGSVRIAVAERAERSLFWPAGIENTGAMRQWGRHATAFVGRRHFDEAFLIDRYLVRAAPAP